MSYWTIMILFIKAFFKALRSTFYSDMLTYMDTNHPELEKGVFTDKYFQGIIKVVSFLGVDRNLNETELRQIKLNVFLPSAATSYAWLMEFEKYIDKYIDSPISRDSDEVYIPNTLTSYFTKLSNVTALDYLIENGEVCAVVPYLEDMRVGLKRVYAKIDTIEDTIMRDYYKGKLRPLIMDTNAFIKDTINWTLLYDRP